MTAAEIRAQLDVKVKPEQRLETLLVKVMLASVVEIAAQFAEQNEKLERIASALEGLQRP